MREPPSDAPCLEAFHFAKRKAAGIHIRPFRDEDEAAVVSLWQRCDLLRPWNDPRRDIARKKLVGPELFLVGTISEQVVACVMAGYEGRRGWLNYLAVDPHHRRCGLGRAIVAEAERTLAALGCPKVNLQVRSSNLTAIGFYERFGYSVEDVVSLGKRLIDETKPA